jgi:hypothetical protein
MKWKATHRLSMKVGARWRHYTVMLMYYGSAYTRREWLAMDFGDFAREPASRRWYFQGQPFTGRVVKIR